MGVDYNAEFGIGYELEVSYAMLAEIDPEWEEWGALDTLSDICRNTPFEILQWGCSYSGEHEYAIILSNPFEKDGYDLTKSIAELDLFIENKGLNVTHEQAELVGGLHVW